MVDEKKLVTNTWSLLSLIQELSTIDALITKSENRGAGYSEYSTRYFLTRVLLGNDLKGRLTLCKIKCGCYRIYRNGEVSPFLLYIREDAEKQHFNAAKRRRRFRKIK